MATDAMQGLSGALAELTARVGPSVVRVEGRRRPSSGVALAAGVVVTASHTVEAEDDAEVEVGLQDGRSVKAQLIGRDEGTDLAALRVEGLDLVPAPWLGGDAAGPVRVGNLVLAISRPGKSARASLGVVSALSESEWRSPAGGRIDRYLETDLALRPGFSGSALVDSLGRVVALNTTGLLRGTASAIPAATVQRVVQQLLAHGSVARGYLGISTLPARLPEAIAKELGQPAALLVSAVDPGSPASRAGLIFGDAVAAFDGRALAHPGALLELLDDQSVGKTVQLKIVRAGELRALALTIGKREPRAHG